MCSTQCVSFQKSKSHSQDYASLVHRAESIKELAAYVEATAKDGSTRELNGNIAVTQTEFLAKVLAPLRPQMSSAGYLSVLLSYAQSLLRLAVPLSAELSALCLALTSRSAHLLQHIADSAGPKTPSLLYYLHSTGLLRHDVAGAKRQLLQEGALSTQLALRTLREANDCESLLNYYNSKQDVGTIGGAEA